MMAKAQATIEERKRALAMQGQSLPSYPTSNGTGKFLTVFLKPSYISTCHLCH